MVAGFLDVERVLIYIMSKVTTVNSSHYTETPRFPITKFLE
jgi:hypothetical protein